MSNNQGTSHRVPNWVGTYLVMREQLYVVSRSMGLTHEESEDMYGELGLRLSRVSDIRKPEALLWITHHRLCIDSLQRARRQRERLTDPQLLLNHEGGDEPSLEAIPQVDWNKILSELTDDLGSVLKLTLEDHSPREIAVIMKKPVKVIYRLKEQLPKQIKRILKPEKR